MDKALINKVATTSSTQVSNVSVSSDTATVVMEPVSGRSSKVRIGGGTSTTSGDMVLIDENVVEESTDMVVEETAETDVEVAVETGVDESTDTAVEEIIENGVDEIADTVADETAQKEVDETLVSDEVVLDEVAMKEIIVADGYNVGPIVDGGYKEPIYEEGTYDPSMGMGITEVKDPLLSSWLFVIGISAAVLFVSVALGAFLARRKIKKGIELYED